MMPATGYLIKLYHHRMPRRLPTCLAPACTGLPLDHAQHVTACTSCGAFLWGDLEMRPPCSRFLQAHPESYVLYRDPADAQAPVGHSAFHLGVSVCDVSCVLHQGLCSMCSCIVFQKVLHYLTSFNNMTYSEVTQHYAVLRI
jgi:hypothetical protein